MWNIYFKETSVRYMMLVFKNSYNGNYTLKKNPIFIFKYYGRQF